MLLKKLPNLDTLKKFHHLVKQGRLPLVITFLLVSLGLASASGLPFNSTSLGQHQIELQEEGFYPHNLVIKRGESVSFTSSRGSFFWPASDLHPTHSQYPEFDPKMPIDPKGSWTFKFNKPGVWKFHDHLSPAFRGTITVTEESQNITLAPLSLQCDRPETEKVPLQCRKAELLKKLSQEGLDKSLQHLEEMYKTDREMAASCHGVAHDIGLASYPLYLQDKDSVLTPRAVYCASGFYHGFMEALLGATKDVRLSRQFCLYVDAKLTSLAPDSYLQCFHGIGHGAIEFTLGTGLRPSSNEQTLIRPALKLCEEASQTDSELYRCASGAFNAVANFYISGQYGIKASQSDPLLICKIQADKYKESCYGNMNSYLISRTNQDLGEALKFVASLEDSHAPKAVWYLAGMASANNLLGYDQDKIDRSLNACRNLSPGLKKSCLEGLTQGFLEHGTPSLEYLDVIKFCSLDLLKVEEKEVCFSYALGGLEGWYDRAKAERICREIDPSIQPYCK